jgi:hypothetical protein
VPVGLTVQGKPDPVETAALRSLEADRVFTQPEREAVARAIAWAIEELRQQMHRAATGQPVIGPSDVPDSP